jgi:cob(I)alamin adenosyltransferase
MTDQPPTEAPAPPPKTDARSVVIVNTGDGKGKTTAAIGVLVRAVARGWRAAVVQFVKGGDWKVGEEEIATRLGVDWWTLGEGFTWDSEDLDVDAATAWAAWEAAKDRIGSGDYELVVLDEITYPINWGWIDGADVAATIRDRPPSVNVIATGRDAPPALVDVADTVTEMVNVRHAFDRGIRARRGIEY